MMTALRDEADLGFEELIDLWCRLFDLRRWCVAGARFAAVSHLLSDSQNVRCGSCFADDDELPRSIP